MARAKKLPSGNWRVLVYAGKDARGKRRYESFTAETKKEAEFLATQYSLDKKDRLKTDLTLRQAAENYIQSISNVVSPWTVTTYQRILHNDLAPIANYKVPDITGDVVQRYINDYAKSHAPKTVRSTHGFLSAVLKSVAPDIVLHTKLPKPDKAEITIPTDADIRAVMDAAPEAMKIAIMLASNFGLRRGEICALTWADVQGGKLDVNKALAFGDGGNWVIKAPKSISGYRSMPIPPAVQSRLDAYRPESVTDRDRIIPLTPSTITKRWGELVKACNIPHCRFHDLRHYNASVMLSLGIPDKYAMERMGHATPNMLKRVYQHTMASKRSEVDQKIEKYMDEHDL